MAISGNLNAIRLILSYIDGLPHIRQEITYKEDTQNEISDEVLLSIVNDIRDERLKRKEYDQNAPKLYTND